MSTLGSVCPGGVCCRVEAETGLALRSRLGFGGDTWQQHGWGTAALAPSTSKAVSRSHGVGLTSPTVAEQPGRGLGWTMEVCRGSTSSQASCLVVPRQKNP